MAVLAAGLALASACEKPAPTRPEAAAERAADRAVAPLRLPALPDDVAARWRAGEAAAREAGSLRQVGASVIAEWRASLDRIDRASKRGARATAKRRIILAALEAPTEEEYHRILRRLTDQRAAVATPEAGRSIFRPAAFAASRSRTTGSSAAWRVRPSAALLSVTDVCTTIWDGVEYTGECSTDAEIAEGLAMLDAMDAEVSADWAEAQAECEAVFGGPACQEVAEGPAATTNSRYAFAALATHPAHAGPAGRTPRRGGIGSSVNRHVRVAGFPAPRNTSTTAVPCAAPVDGIARVVAFAHMGDSCFADGFAAAVGVASWVLAKVGAAEVMTAAKPSVAGRVVAVAGAMLAGFSAGYGVNAYLHCISASKKSAQEAS